MGDLLHDAMFAHLKGEMEDAAKSGEDTNADNKQPSGRAYETERGGMPDHPRQTELTENVNPTDPTVRVARERTDRMVKADTWKGTEGGADKNADAGAKVDRRRSGWWEAAQSMGAPWYPYT
ncbi:hypothetical protein LTR29_018191 [Friedmanniomyces endolithicus]|uniref:Uncharacterized protein n=1 Tax=Friedmanniomyces endolithicus TaxID=329885 RepID=A0A4U0UR14_9PEZI|nr:hypothetical protein LTS09_001350 [Friedmanniomyces endolithicus]KAK0296451.1 hypothetical protein LTS00_004776 [Friedmanniomyces endolithicus]KAK0324476.1 hypothetical protein LTR82_004180 [Friedmanniomyces endolithicus]KAK0924153.1 hypothetical protein LTR29_018191 [Friedmanniomyces endolithicus]KAK0931950.1 hypothetical protein LTR57_000169 [Friedmanniomyces endolithicus]